LWALFFSIASSLLGLRYRRSCEVVRATAQMEELGPNRATLTTDGELDYSTRPVKLTDDNLAPLEKLSGIWLLDLSGHPVTDAGLAHVRCCHGLTWLDLEDTRITDEGLEHVARLKHLERLYLSNTAVTDRGLDCLVGLRNLEEIHLHGTRVTQRGVDRLQRALPRVTILWP